MAGCYVGAFLQFITGLMEIGIYAIVLVRVFLLEMGYCYSI